MFFLLINFKVRVRSSPHGFSGSKPGPMHSELLAEGLGFRALNPKP